MPKHSPILRPGKMRCERGFAVPFLEHVDARRHMRIEGPGVSETTRLGERASEGCVRVDWRTDDEYTINAYWLWTHLPWRTKVLVLP